MQSIENKISCFILDVALPLTKSPSFTDYDFGKYIDPRIRRKVKILHLFLKVLSKNFISPEEDAVEIYNFH